MTPLERLAEVIWVLDMPPPVMGMTHEPLRQRLFRAQRGRCYLCDRPLRAPGRGVADGEVRSYDHVIPKSEGGLNNGNRLLAHKRCNTLKRSRLPYPCELIFLAAVNLALEETAGVKRFRR